MVCFERSEGAPAFAFAEGDLPGLSEEAPERLSVLLGVLTMLVAEEVGFVQVALPLLPAPGPRFRQEELGVDGIDEEVDVDAAEKGTADALEIAGSGVATAGATGPMRGVRPVAATGSDPQAQRASMWSMKAWMHWTSER